MTMNAADHWERLYREKGAAELSWFQSPPGGPTRCSGLLVQRHSVETLSALLGPEFELRSSTLEDHHTPARVAQRFLHTRWQARA